MNDTIAGISTTLGVGAISIIRVSGDNAIKVVNSVFKGKNLENVDSHTINYGHIIDKDETIDEVLVSIMKAPRTFTREDVVEINCHGGIATTNKILEVILLNGARLAEAGEFTKRAFLNGRIDLVEAESIMDIINAKTDKARKLSINQLEGRVSTIIRNFRQELLELLASIEVNIDYPEYEDIEEMTNSMILSNIDSIEKEINNILLSFQQVSSTVEKVTYQKEQPNCIVDLREYVELFKNGNLKQISNSGSLYKYVSEQEVKERMNVIKENYTGKVCKITGTDEDKTPVKYIVTDTTNYSIDSTGQLVIKNPIDYEKKTLFEYMYFVADAGNGSQCSFKQFQ